MICDACKGSSKEFVRQVLFALELMKVRHNWVVWASAKSALLNTTTLARLEVTVSNSGLEVEAGALASLNSITASTSGTALINSFRALFMWPGYQLMLIEMPELKPHSSDAAMLTPPLHSD